MSSLRVGHVIWASVMVAGLAVSADAQDVGGTAPVRAQVSGTVFDSVSMTPLSGALVRIVRADDPSIGRSAISDTTGRFAYDSVPSGVWLASFLHPVLDSLRLEPGIVRLEIADATPVAMPLATPSGRTLFAATCGTGFPAEYGVITGEVRRAEDDAPIAGASVEIEWPEWVLQKRALLTDTQRMVATTDASGRYKLCGAPAGSTLRTVTWSGADTSGVVEVIVPPSGFAVQDFAVGSVEYVAAAPSDSVGAAAGTQVRRGRAVIRGTVTTTNGAPLPNAAVRVIGGGATVQTSATGEFVIVDAVTGTQSIEARAIGYQPVRLAVRLSATTASVVTLSLATRTVQLDTVRVMAGREIPWDVRGIERRWRSGLGRFLDGKTVVERASMFATDALRGMAGVFVRQVDRGFGQDIFMRSNQGGECRASLFVDGLSVDFAGRGGISVDDFVRPDMVSAIEVYNRPTLVPAEYLTMARGCGVIAVWTKLGTGNVPVLPPKSERR